MPGPAKFRGGALTHALSSNTVSKWTIDDRVRNVLELVKRSAKAGITENQKETTNNTPETSAFMRKVASETIVLMKNEKGVLPLKKDKPIILIGPNAKTSVFCGGGSSAMTPYYAISPYEGIEAKTGKGNIKHTVGAYSHKELPLIGTHLKTSDGKPGFHFLVYNDPPSVKDRELVDDLLLTDSNMFLVDYKNPKLSSPLFYGDFEGYFTPEEDGEYDFGLCISGTGKLFIDGKLLIDNETVQTPGWSFFGSGTVEEKGTIYLKKGQSYKITVDFVSAPASKFVLQGAVSFGGGGIRLGCARRIDPEEEIARAVELATSDPSAQVVIVAGLNGDWESEGHDRADMSLPGHSNALISAVTKANPSTVVVMQSGTPVEMPWLSSTHTLLHAWYGGNETGNAIADVLFGDVNPGGKLPLTFPLKLQDNPAYLNFRSEAGRTLYGEDVYIGYRYYNALDRPVAFPFGHGLSYTTFKLSNLKVKTHTASNSDKTLLAVSVNVTNTGPVVGAEVVQVYIAQKNPSIRRPPKELQGFQKVVVQPGKTEKAQVVTELKYAASFWDESRDMWVCEKDSYEVLVGTSSQGPFEKGEFQIEKTFWWKGL
jgi:beta-glucosidase